MPPCIIDRTGRARQTEQLSAIMIKRSPVARSRFSMPHVDQSPAPAGYPGLDSRQSSLHHRTTIFERAVSYQQLQLYRKAKSNR
jgi:hypothetical protein